jgi:hypothetical protein
MIRTTLARLVLRGAPAEEDGLAVGVDADLVLADGERELRRALASPVVDVDVRFSAPSLLVLTDRRLAWIDPQAGDSPSMVGRLVGNVGSSVNGVLRRGVGTSGPLAVLAGQAVLADVTRVGLRGAVGVVRLQLSEGVVALDLGRPADARALAAAVLAALGVPDPDVRGRRDRDWEL